MSKFVERVDPDKTHGGRRAGAGGPSSSGGRRPGAGRPKGSKSKITLLKEEAAKEIASRKLMKQQILESIPRHLRKDAEALKKAIAEIDEEELTQEIKKRVALHSNNLLTALLSAAMGEQFLYKVVHDVDARGKVTQKHIQVTDPDEIRVYLDNPLSIEGEDYYYIAKKSPDITAINSVLDRFMGRPVQQDNPKDKSEKNDIKIFTVNFSGNPQGQNALPAPSESE